MTTAAAPGADLVIKGFVADEINLTPGERTMVAYITCDNVDLEGDVVVTSGVDFKHYLESNPIVVAIHDLGKWPIGQCQWIKHKKNGNFNGLVAKCDFDEDPDSERIWLKVKRKTVRSVSVGFMPPDDMKAGEWGPPTREEIRLRPDWAKARRIIRRCVLKEYSICPIGMNPSALIVAVSKGLNRPLYEGTKAMDETEEAEGKAAEPCECGKADCDKCSPADKEPVETKAEDEEPPKEEVSDEDDFDEDDESSLPIKTGDHVDVKCKGLHGCGRVEKIHRKGMVEHVDEDMIGTKDDPAARVRLYKAHGDGHRASETRIAAKLKSLTRRAEPFKEPSKKAVAEIETKAAKLEPLPPLIALSEAEVQQEAIRQSVEASVKRINKILGVV